MSCRLKHSNRSSLSELLGKLHIIYNILMPMVQSVYDYYKDKNADEHSDIIKRMKILEDSTRLLDEIYINVDKLSKGYVPLNLRKNFSGSTDKNSSSQTILIYLVKQFYNISINISDVLQEVIVSIPHPSTQDTFKSKEESRKHKWEARTEINLKTLKFDHRVLRRKLKELLELCIKEGKEINVDAEILQNQCIENCIDLLKLFNQPLAAKEEEDSPESILSLINEPKNEKSQLNSSNFVQKKKKAGKVVFKKTIENHYTALENILDRPFKISNIKVISNKFHGKKEEVSFVKNEINHVHFLNIYDKTQKYKNVLSSKIRRGKLVRNKSHLPNKKKPDTIPYAASFMSLPLDKDDLEYIETKTKQLSLDSNPSNSKNLEVMFGFFDNKKEANNTYITNNTCLPFLCPKMDFYYINNEPESLPQSTSSLLSSEDDNCKDESNEKMLEEQSLPLDPINEFGIEEKIENNLNKDNSEEMISKAKKIKKVHWANDVVSNTCTFITMQASVSQNFKRTSKSKRDSLKDIGVNTKSIKYRPINSKNKCDNDDVSDYRFPYEASSCSLPPNSDAEDTNKEQSKKSVKKDSINTKLNKSVKNKNKNVKLSDEENLHELSESASDAYFDAEGEPFVPSNNSILNAHQNISVKKKIVRIYREENVTQASSNESVFDAYQDAEDEPQNTVSENSQISCTYPCSQTTSNIPISTAERISNEVRDSLSQVAYALARVSLSDDGNKVFEILDTSYAEPGRYLIQEPNTVVLFGPQPSRKNKK